MKRQPIQCLQSYIFYSLSTRWRYINTFDFLNVVLRKRILFNFQSFFCHQLSFCMLLYLYSAVFSQLQIIVDLVQSKYKTVY